MLYPNYVWITYGWYYDDEWWRIDDESYSSCSSSERAQVLTGAIALSHYPLPVDEESTMANSVCTTSVRINEHIPHHHFDFHGYLVSSQIYTVDWYMMQCWHMVAV